MSQWVSEIHTQLCHNSPWIRKPPECEVEADNADIWTTSACKDNYHHQMRQGLQANHRYHKLIPSL